ncbi:hypothetical protein SDC9_53737 [bioreactor metagenome]|uniref:Uncharacterized protein n=1 Tax=bioreactor metagenome TaxID=1076179 RepID=A0A644WV07_9ZZZZ
MNKFYKISFFILVIALFAVISIGSQERSEFRTVSNELIEENRNLKEQFNDLQHEKDSIDSLLANMHEDTAIIIRNRIITRYETDFRNIDTAGTDANFRIFTSWISENDSVIKW